MNDYTLYSKIDEEEILDKGGAVLNRGDVRGYRAVQ
jgi:hypothetical protein